MCGPNVYEEKGKTRKVWQTSHFGWHIIFFCESIHFYELSNVWMVHLTFFFFLSELAGLHPEIVSVLVHSMLRKANHFEAMITSAKRSSNLYACWACLWIFETQICSGVFVCLWLVIFFVCPRHFFVQPWTLPGVFQLWDLTAGKELHTFDHNKAAVRALQFHPNEFFLATGGDDR